MTVNFTLQARDKFKSMLKEGEMSSPEIRMAKGCAGCGGLLVGLSVNDPRQETDKVMKVDDLTIFVEESSEEYIGNTTVDYKDSEYGGNFILSNEYGSSVCFV